MYERFYSPNLMALASSQVGEDSLSVSLPCTRVNCLCDLILHFCFHTQTITSLLLHPEHKVNEVTSPALSPKTSLFSPVIGTLLF